MKTQLRFVNEAAPTVKGKNITGVAAVFNRLSNDLGGFREIIRPGAFDRSLREIAAGTRTVDARTQHQGGLLVCGTTANDTLELWVDENGLNYDIAPPDTAEGDSLRTMVRDKYIRHSSFAFECGKDDMKWDWSQNPPVVEILNCDLIDVAPCSRPAYEETTVKVRSMMKPPVDMPRFSESGTRVEMKAEGDRKVVEFHLMDAVMPNWMRKYDPNLVTSGSIIEKLNQYPDAERIDLFINSPGGEVFEGIAIMNVLKEHPAPVHVSVRGLAASIAGVIAMAGDHIQMGAGTFLMVHGAWTIAQGNAQDMRNTANLLDKIDGSIAGILAKRSGKDAKTVSKWMSTDTWFTAEEAVSAGLADRVAGAESAASAGVEGKRCREMNFRNIPAALGGSYHEATVEQANIRAMREANERAIKKELHHSK